MDELDKKIGAMLDAEEQATLEQFAEQGLWAQLGGLFDGKTGWLTAVTLVIGTVMTIIGLYAAWKFATLADTPSMLRWGGLAWIMLQSQMMIKLWSWMRMETNRSIREIKRLELQVSMLQAKLKG